MFIRVKDLKGVPHTINLAKVDYFAPDRDCTYVRIKMSNYVLNIEFSEWSRIKNLIEIK